MIDAPCQVAFWRATSHGRRNGSTTSAGSARVAGVANAFAVPNAITSRKIGAVDVGFVPAYQARPHTVRACAQRAVPASALRSIRSASVPVTNTRSAAGANSARPSRPRASGLPVRSNTCLPNTVVRSATAVDDAPTDDSNVTIERVGFGGAGESKTLF